MYFLIFITPKLHHLMISEKFEQNVCDASMEIYQKKHTSKVLGYYSVAPSDL